MPRPMNEGADQWLARVKALGLDEVGGVQAICGGCLKPIPVYPMTCPCGNSVTQDEVWEAHGLLEARPFVLNTPLTPSDVVALSPHA